MSGDESSGPVQPALATEMRRHPLHQTHAVYAIVMLGAAMAMGGPGGLVLGVSVVATWAWVFYRKPRTRGLREALLLWTGLLLFCCVGLLPLVSRAREPMRSLACRNNLRQLALALHNYHDQHGSLPPAYIVDGDGRPVHSWRVLILPYMEQAELFSQYRFDEPWDGPNNRTLGTRMPRVFACPSDKHGSMFGNTMTSYLAVVGPTTAWPGEYGRSLSAFRSGSPNPLLIVESHSQAVEWMEPRDLDFDTAVHLLTSVEPFDDGHASEGFFYDYLGRNIAVANAACWFVPLMSRESAESLLQIDNGRETPDAWTRIKSAEEVWRPRYGSWFRFGVFFLLAFFPLPWVFRPGKISVGKASRPASTACER